MPSSIKYAFDSLTIARKNKLINSVFSLKLLILPFSLSHLWDLSYVFSNSDTIFWPVCISSRYKDYFDNRILVEFNFLTTWYSTVDINGSLAWQKFSCFWVQSVFYLNIMFFFNLDQVRYSLMCEKGNNSYSKKIYLCLNKSILFLYNYLPLMT